MRLSAAPVPAERFAGFGLVRPFDVRPVQGGLVPPGSPVDEDPARVFGPLAARRFGFFAAAFFAGAAGLAVFFLTALAAGRLVRAVFAAPALFGRRLTLLACRARVLADARAPVLARRAPPREPAPALRAAAPGLRPFLFPVFLAICCLSPGRSGPAPARARPGCPQV